MAANYPPPWNQVGVGHCHVKYYVPESSGRQGFSMNLSMQGGQDGSMSTGRNHQSPNNTSQFTNAAGQDSYESLTLADLLASAPFGRPSILRGLLEQGKGPDIFQHGVDKSVQTESQIFTSSEVNLLQLPGHTFGGIPVPTEVRSSSGFGSSADEEDTDDEDRPLIIDESVRADEEDNTRTGNEIIVADKDEQMDTEVATFYYSDDIYEGIEVQVVPLDLSVRR